MAETTQNLQLHLSIAQLFSNFKLKLISLFDKYETTLLHQVQQPLPLPPSLPYIVAEAKAKAASTGSTPPSLPPANPFTQPSPPPEFQKVSRDTPPLDWHSFPVALQEQFSTTEFTDPAGTLMKFQQITSVLDYQATFATLSSRVTGLSSSLLKSTPLSGLKSHIRRAVISQRPHDPGGSETVKEEIETIALGMSTKKQGDRLDIKFFQP